MIYCACYCCKNFLYCLPPFTSPPCVVELPSNLESRQSDIKAGIFRHDNKKDMGIPNSLVFKHGPIEADSEVEGI